MDPSQKEANMKSKRTTLLAAAIGLAALSGTAAAHGNVDFGFYIGVPAPVYTTPRPAYYGPPPRVYYPPAPVYYGPPAYGVRYGYRDRSERDRRWEHDRRRWD
jgi:hypothetical protein